MATGGGGYDISVSPSSSSSAAASNSAANYVQGGGGGLTIYGSGSKFGSDIPAPAASPKNTLYSAGAVVAGILAIFLIVMFLKK
jgi:hypothetical protein